MFCVTVSSPAPISFENYFSQLPRPRKCLNGRISRSKVRCGLEERETGRTLRLEPEFMPEHVAVIMDGNRRWASERGLAVKRGHEAGREAVRKMSSFFEEVGVKVLSVFALSTENWARPKGEVGNLMSLFMEATQEAMSTNHMRLTTIGNKSQLPIALRLQISLVENITKSRNGLHRIAALNYGGRQDIVEAAKAIASKVERGKMSPEEINEDSFAKELQTSCTEFPNPDLLIRTSGEKRISNFMLWQMAHTELYFVDKYFPDMEREDYMEALISYQERKKRS